MLHLCILSSNESNRFLVRWCSWLSRSPHILVNAKGREFEPRVNHFFAAHDILSARRCIALPFLLLPMRARRLNPSFCVVDCAPEQGPVLNHSGADPRAFARRAIVTYTRLSTRAQR